MEMKTVMKQNNTQLAFAITIIIILPSNHYAVYLKTSCAYIGPSDSCATSIEPYPLTV